jgi:NAD(P)H-dependent FMN reductase
MGAGSVFMRSSGDPRVARFARGELNGTGEARAAKISASTGKTETRCGAYAAISHFPNRRKNNANTSMGNRMLKIAIIIGSTRPGRIGEAVGKWAHDMARQRTDAEFALLDVANFNLPLLDEPLPASSGQYSRPHTRAWSAAVASFDGYVFVTPEYNHGTSGALKNAIDFLFHEWTHKAAGFIGYGGTMGARAIEHLRLVMAAVQVATVVPQVGLSLFTDFEKFAVFKPTEIQTKNLATMLDHVVAWSGALRALRDKEDRP